MKLIGIIFALWCGCVAISAAQVVGSVLGELGFDDAGGFLVGVPVSEGSYYALRHVGGDGAVGAVVDVVLPLGTGGGVQLRDRGAAGRRSAIYRVERIPVTAPEDVDGDGIDDVFELQHPLVLDPVDAADADEDGDEDGETNLAEYLAGTDLAEVIVEGVSFVTSDDITLRGELRRPAARPGTRLPVAILIHQGGRSRSEWRPFLSAFSGAGITTMAFDIRGHGQSGGTFSSPDFDDPDRLPKDLVAALEFVRGRATTDGGRMGVVGASVGGNLACVASQKGWIKTGVNISGKTSAVRNLAAERDLELESMFHIASSGDQGGQRAGWANELFAFTSGARRVEVVPGSSAHGVAVFGADRGLLERVIGWLGETL